eukprot:TRINITY_DN6203_c0_g2_i2.p2 TRINITY_DN6203_c0_g2~~TRINITY_DN6203_c0_g2_i2.p2  ORF type:complete len:113 (-),score=21.97 TRINITY_DN6203_c0_g2_i2:433-771(-)
MGSKQYVLKLVVQFNSQVSLAAALKGSECRRDSNVSTNLSFLPTTPMFPSNHACIKGELVWNRRQTNGSCEKAKIQYSRKGRDVGGKIRPYLYKSIPKSSIFHHPSNVGQGL